MKLTNHMKQWNQNWNNRFGIFFLNSHLFLFLLLLKIDLRLKHFKRQHPRYLLSSAHLCENKHKCEHKRFCWKHKICCWKIVNTKHVVGKFQKKFTNWSSSLDIRRSQYQQYAHPGLGFPSLKHERHVWEYLPKGFPQQLCFTSSLPIFGFQKSKLYHLNGQCHRIWHFPPSVHRRETWVWKINICSNPTLFIFFDLPDMKVSRSTVKMWLSFPRTQDTDLLFRLNTFDNRLS